MSIFVLTNPPLYQMISKKILIQTVVVCCLALPTQAQYPGEEYLGKASFYHKKFNNRKTSCGERFHNDNLMAAHRTLPFGSLVEVTNLANNKSVLVRINDRGPFSHDRLIDVSQTAARALDMIAAGTADVKVRVLMVPTPEGSVMLPSFGEAPKMDFPQHQAIRIDSTQKGRYRIMPELPKN